MDTVRTKGKPGKKRRSTNVAVEDVGKGSSRGIVDISSDE